ncbi:MAG: aldehyde dehydrogenase family protein [Deltaproteobacteria bacterium]|nr:aldehyde dehydrogenase family protein [Deltaproteobacteria bacterium]
MTTFTVRNPATLEVITTYEATPLGAIAGLVQRGDAAGIAWQALTYRERGAILLRARQYLLQHLDQIADVITAENGKPRLEALTAELYPMADLLYYFAHHTGAHLRPHRIPIGLMTWLRRTSILHYQPHGVVAVIAPWNYPFSIPAGAIAMALVTGNTVVFKPSEYALHTAQQIMAMFRAAGLPAEVLQLVIGDGTAGAALVEAAVDKVFFTGSVATGQRIMATCATRPIPCTLELGGKDAMIVRADADLDLASSGAVWGAFTNAGQCCASVERCYVDARIAGPFIDQVVAKTRQLRQGPGTDPTVEVGPLTTATQLATVERHVAEAVARGATLRCGGTRNADFAGTFYRPTVLTDVTHADRIMREETFGPVLPIMVVGSDHEAITMANDSPYGLTASIWTRDRRAAERMAAQLAVGTVTINECLYTHAICQTPWGGRKQSGLGRTHGAIGLSDMVVPQHRHTNCGPPHKDLWWYPYDRSVYDLFVQMAHRVTGPWWQRLPALPRLLRSRRMKKW